MAENQFMPCPEESALIQLPNTANDTSSIFPALQKKKFIGVILYCQGLSDHQGQQRVDLREAKRKPSAT